MGPRRRARILAVQALFAYDFTRCGVEDLTGFPWADGDGEDKPADIGGDTRDFAVLLIAGAIGNLDAIDSAIQKQLEHWDMGRLNRLDLAVLRVSVFSLFFMKDIPPSVVIDEAVDIARDFGTDDSYRFVNGVLDGIRKAMEDRHESA
ncbi:MAG: transcription antitermination factor NusB [Spirochaetia bacterium]|jgi:N utilization substance protein B|nr:transcription antitermination factor NusB [Spirochaetia bacterium]